MCTYPIYLRKLYLTVFTPFFVFAVTMRAHVILCGRAKGLVLVEQDSIVWIISAQFFPCYDYILPQLVRKNAI